MCGICGAAGLSDKGLMARMCDCMKHRGPDSTGFYTDGYFSLGADRLAIIDLQGGNQPIHNEEGTIQLIFNGEVYNYVELRRELEEKGHEFYTDSDTETVIHAYEEWGAACLKRINGMFAFALADTKSKTLFLARDRFGEKPLYYTLKEGSLLFASELQALMLCEGIGNTLDPEAVDLFLTYSFIPSPKTIYKGIFKLPPASYLTFHDGHLDISRYWDLTFGNQGGVYDLYERMLESVKLRLRSDVPVGAFLSGGIDSSVIVSLMKRVSDSPIKTFTIAFPSYDSNLKPAREMASSLGTDHHEIIVEPDSYKLLPKLLWQFGEPFADASMIPTYLISEAARPHVKVAIGGEGGDELFMGYDFLREPSAFHVYERIPAKKYALGLAKHLPLPPKLGRAVWLLDNTDYMSRDAIGRFVLRLAHFPSSSLNCLRVGSHDTESYLYWLTKGLLRGTSSQIMNYLQIRSVFSEGMLTKADRMSMANSLELRSPMLDHHLFEYVFQFPPQLRQRKRIFKEMAVLSGLVPKKVAYRKKAGFGIPLEAWFGRDWQGFASEVLHGDGPTRFGFDRTYINKLIEKSSLHAPKLFQLVMLFLWDSMRGLHSQPKTN